MSARASRVPAVVPSTPEWIALAEALDSTPSPCKRMPEWTSDDPEDRSVAARACSSCPLVELCHAAAESTGEDFGVYAGVDRSPRAGRPATTTRKSA